MDDEKYFYLSNTSILGNDVYYTSDKSITPVDVKFKLKTKFEDEVLIWAAISGNGLSDAYIHKSKNAIDYQIYINQCLKKRLLPFQKDMHPDNNYVFWPELASSHYAKITTE
jgi:hypothetical protein